MKSVSAAMLQYADKDILDSQKNPYTVERDTIFSRVIHAPFPQKPAVGNVRGVCILCEKYGKSRFWCLLGVTKEPAV